MHRQQASRHKRCPHDPGHGAASNHQPDLIRNAQTLDPLQHQLHGEGHLQLGDHKHRRFALANNHDIAAAQPSLHLEALRPGDQDVGVPSG